MKLSSSLFTAFTALASVAGMGTSVRAAETWVPLSPGAPAGTPATLTLDLMKSTPSITSCDLSIAGFWRDEVLAPDGVKYHTIRIPGLGHVGQIGAPDLPAMRATLAVVTDATEVKLASATVTSLATFPNIVVYPLGTPETDEDYDPTADPGPGDTDGTPGQFQKDASIYGGAATWPATDAKSTSPVGTRLAGIHGGDCEGYPVRWNPATKVLSVARSAHYEFLHAGATSPAAALNKATYGFAKQLFFNNVAVDDLVLENLDKFQARYLIIAPIQYVTTPSLYEDGLKRIVQLKKSQGFEVQVKTLEGGENWLQVLALIVSWYNATVTGKEHYCLLAGDITDIPMAFDIASGAKTDDVYGSPLDLDLNEEVFVGRISFDGAMDLRNQVDKIVEYEMHPVVGGDYRGALLVAHKEGAPGKYVGAHEAVANATYSDPPIFHKRYGPSEFNNAGVSADINAGVGVVCYRGHGSTNTWSQWNQANGDFHKNDANALHNDVMPVVWSISCFNHDLYYDNGGTSDCIGEAWLEVGWGAVASYGAVVATDTIANHTLDFNLFRAVYGLGLTVHSHAIAFGEWKMQQVNPESNNAWHYNLLGDPSMHIRTKIGENYIQAVAPSFLGAGSSAQSLVIQAKKSDGMPLGGALVAISKETANGKDEIFDNGYTDGQGYIAFQIVAKTTGDLRFTIQDDDSNVAEGVIEIVGITGCEGGENDHYGEGKPGTNGTPTLSALTIPTIGQVDKLQIASALSGAPAFLLLGFASASLPFDGGTVLIAPAQSFALPPILADGTLTLQGTLPGNPALCGADVYFQAMVVDPGAAGFYHVALTNALRQTIGG